MELKEHPLGLVLFAQQPLDELLGDHELKAWRRLQAWNDDDLLIQASADVVDVSLDIARVECPALEDPVLDAPSQVHREAEAFVPGHGRMSSREMTRYVLCIPFRGDVAVFWAQPNPGLVSPPRGNLRHDELQLIWEGEHPRTPR